TVMAQGPGADIADTAHSTVLCARGEDATLSARHVVLLLLIAGVFAALRLWRLTSYGLYGDEIFSLRLASANWTELIGGVARDIVHPPLFYTLLKLWIGIGGDSVLWLKLFPALTSIAALVPLFLLCRELKMKPGAIELALGLMAVNAYLVYYSQELRMYSVLLTLTAFSLLLFARLLSWSEAGGTPALSGSEEAGKMPALPGAGPPALAGSQEAGKMPALPGSGPPALAGSREAGKMPALPGSRAWNRLALFVVNLLLVYTHYYGWLIVAGQVLFALIWARRES